MTLDSLYQLVEKLRQRIEAHSALLRQSEMLTRYVLVDPLLRELGWDTENPDLVRPEYSAGSGSADYALLADGQPVIMVEAKRLDRPLREGLTQAINYCIQEGTPYFAVTDGRLWEVYDIYKQGALPQKILVAFDLAGQTPSDVVLQALALWRPGVETGKVKLPQVPVTPQIQEPSEPSQQPTVSAADLAAPGPGWVSLSQLNPKTYELAPKSLRFPDGNEEPVSNWTDFARRVANWLWEKGILVTSRCPIRYNTRYLLNATPVHPNGKGFFQSQQIGSLC